ncbi:hypothetical protein [Rhodopseudomonas palustris]|uniref:Bacteriophage tail tape measure N-terminal domain-containing protein n=1 Tax=Rhodopseudomonas palustris TaxID=1076 RepID=A0A418V4A1_RHOPL|nr:hypothetical protein [Rhodopseudomonas palustris]RJF70865.1 hypothetical protein D4Q52_14645 [Rhodopseudomonas palustris]
MRVSLQIDGDAKGAEQAAVAASRAISDLGKQTEATNRSIEESFKRAAGALARSSEEANKHHAANDNVINQSVELAEKLSHLAENAGGSASAFTKAAGGAATLAKGLVDVGKASGTIPVLTGWIGLAITAAQVLFNVVSAGNENAQKRLDEHGRLIGVVRDAYRDAGRTAGEFFEQSKDFTRLQLELQVIKDAAALQTSVGKMISNATTFGDIGDFLSGVKQVKPEFVAFEDALFKLQDGFKTGTPDVKAFMDEVARIALLDPALRKAAGTVVDLGKEAFEAYKIVQQNEAARRLLDGKPRPEDRRRIGLGDQTGGDAVGEIERLIKAFERQTAAQEAEALAAGKSVGETARLRAETVLLDAAQRSGSGVTSELTERITKLAERMGAAAQKAAELRLQSDLAFEASQLGRSSTDAVVADRLRGVYGTDVTAQMDSAIAGTIRFNEAMKELKATTTEIATGALADFRAELRSGATAWEAFQKAGENAINRLVDKLASKALDNLISNLFGSLLGGSGGLFGGSLGGLGGVLRSLFGGSSSGTGLSLTGTGGLFAIGGYTGDMPTTAVAGLVHGREFVINAASTARHYPLLKAINENRLPGYAGGGYVGIAPPFLAALGSNATPPQQSAAPDRQPGAAHVTNLYISTPDPRSFAEDRATMMRGVNRTILRAQRYS